MFGLHELIEKEFWTRVSGFLRSIKTRYLFLLLLIIGTSTYAYSNPEHAERAAISAYTYGTVAFSCIRSNPAPPLRDGHSAKLKQFTGRLNTQLSNFVNDDQGRSNSLNGSALGQIMTALQSQALHDQSWPRDFFLRAMNKETMAWEEIETSGCSDAIRAIHYPSTFWATYALHNSGDDVIHQLQVVLDGQHEHGFWTTFAITGKPVINASTYGTVLATLLLHYTRTAPYVDNALRADIDNAIERAVIWLSTKHHDENRWLWLDYPNNEPEASISIAASAMVVHFLNVVDGDFTTNIDVPGISNDFPGHTIREHLHTRREGSVGRNDFRS